MTLRSIRLQVPPPPRLSLLLIALLLACCCASTDDENAASTVAPIQEALQHVIAQFPPSPSSPEGRKIIPVVYSSVASNTSSGDSSSSVGGFRFNHLVLDPKTGQLYAGAVNRLLQLKSDLTLVEQLVTGMRLCSTFKTLIIIIFFLNILVESTKKLFCHFFAYMKVEEPFFFFKSLEAQIPSSTLYELHR